jgi:hypothetical protein
MNQDSVLLERAKRVLNDWLTFTNHADPEWQSPEQDTKILLEQIKGAQEEINEQEYNWERSYVKPEKRDHAINCAVNDLNCDAGVFRCTCGLK